MTTFFDIGRLKGQRTNLTKETISQYVETLSSFFIKTQNRILSNFLIKRTPIPNYVSFLERTTKLTVINILYIFGFEPVDMLQKPTRSSSSSALSELLTQKLNVLQKENDELNLRLEKISAERCSAQDDLSIVCKSLEILKNDKKRLEAEKDDLRFILQSSKSSKEFLQSEIDMLKRDLQERISTMSQVNLHSASLSTSHENLEKEISVLKQTNAAAQEISLRLTKERDLMLDRVAQLEQELQKTRESQVRKLENTPDVGEKTGENKPVSSPVYGSPKSVASSSVSANTGKSEEAPIKPKKTGKIRSRLKKMLPKKSKNHVTSPHELENANLFAIEEQLTDANSG